ncbi:uncharacterized protein LOC110662197 [Hevea brasiliensis]|uniref:uncharacterized protein LOC110662197 n=1 Tax=Hevea brasiliensis TaxID=3981 RepID=UPI0025DEE8A3|nr:uncharacterized protein LOC110662197 [Hevea brasiliensis]
MDSGLPVIFFTAICGSLVASIRNSLWHKLSIFNDSISDLWLLVGDFNALLSSEDRQGGLNRRSGISNQFVSCFASAALSELVFRGPKFTWKRGSLYQRLDRAFYYGPWSLKFPEADVLRLPWIHSNHRPQLVRLQSWSPPTIVGFANDLKEWNGKVFGNVFHFKKQLLARIEGIQRVLENRTSSHLMELECQLRRELDVILYREELIWFQKSRSEWIQWDDKNSSYFHQRTIKRRKCNRIIVLKDEEGNRLEEQGTLKKLAIDFFSKLYLDDDIKNSCYKLRGLFPTLSDDCLKGLDSLFLDKKIKVALFEMKPWKALGPNGLHAIFFKNPSRG